jgi:hypothetical protein
VLLCVSADVSITLNLKRKSNWLSISFVSMMLGQTNIKRVIHILVICLIGCLCKQLTQKTIFNESAFQESAWLSYIVQNYCTKSAGRISDISNQLHGEYPNSVGHSSLDRTQVSRS